VKLKQLVTTETKQRLRCRIGFDALSRRIGNKDRVSRPAEERAKVVVGCGDRLGAQVMAQGLTLLLIEHSCLTIATTVSVQRCTG
jgi:hypothetical protein